MIDLNNFTMRRACPCGSLVGRVVEKSGQNTVTCTACDRFQYNAPRSELGGGDGIDDVIPFGKHKGKTWRELSTSDRPYLEWAAKNISSKSLARRARAALEVSR